MVVLKQQRAIRTFTNQVKHPSAKDYSKFEDEIDFQAKGQLENRRIDLLLNIKIQIDPLLTYFHTASKELLEGAKDKE